MAELFFTSPASDGFLIADGAALAAQQLTTRPTQDLDLFTRAGRSTVSAARDAFENAATERGWSVRRIRESDTFCRLVVTGDEDLLIDLALDSPPNLPPEDSIAGPTFGLDDLAGRKLLALFDRAEARDFADIFVLDPAIRHQPHARAPPSSKPVSTSMFWRRCSDPWRDSTTARSRFASP